MNWALFNARASSNAHLGMDVRVARRVHGSNCSIARLQISRVLNACHPSLLLALICLLLQPSLQFSPLALYYVQQEKTQIQKYKSIISIRELVINKENFPPIIKLQLLGLNMVELKSGENKDIVLGLFKMCLI